MNETPTFMNVKERLDQIVEVVEDESTSLDEALALYEEAMKLGIHACDLSEKDIFPEQPDVVSDDNVETIEISESESAADVKDDLA